MDGRHRPEGPGQDDLPGAERFAEPAGGVGEPRQGPQRVAQAGRAVPGGRRRAVDTHLHLGVDRFELVEPAAPGAEDEQPGRGVVGDRVPESDVPHCDPAVDDLEGGDGVVDAVADTPVVERAVGEVLPEHEGDLRLDLRLQQALEGHGFVLGVLHVVEQDTEVGAVHAELPLDRR